MTSLTLMHGEKNLNNVKDFCIKIMMLGVGACKMAKKDVIKAVIYIDDVVDKSKKEIYQFNTEQEAKDFADGSWKNK